MNILTSRLQYSSLVLLFYIPLVPFCQHPYRMCLPPAPARRSVLVNSPLIHRVFSASAVMGLFRPMHFMASVMFDALGYRGCS